MSDVYLDSSAIGYRLRARRLMVAVVVIFAVYIGRLVQLQIVEGDELGQASENNFIRMDVLTADRGAIYDRHMRPLAQNRPAFDLYVTPAQVKNMPALLDGLREVLGLDALDVDRLREKLEEPRGIARFQPVRVDRDIDRERVAKAEALRAQVDGISIKVGQQRAYPEGDVGAHLVGYLGRPRPEEVAGGDPLRFQETSMVGRFGLEEVYETTLAGRNGFERFVVNARGARAVDQRALGAVDDVIREPAVPGNDLVLTIDSDVQAILLQALSRYESGAVVVVDPRDGSVIGMVSKPGFDPNLWSGRLSADVKRATDENPYNPMIDKTVHSFFPGSIYKIVTALAGLEENVIQADQKIDSPGSYEFGNHIFHCHKLSGHGLVDLSGAIAASADVYFYKLGEKLGIDTLATYATRFGFGRRSGLGINGESPGIVPTKAWHDEHTPGGYQFGLALSTAIGQGDVRATPLQLAMAYAALANGGTLYAPRIIDRIQSPDGTVVQRVAPKVIGTLGARPEHIQQIIAGLERAVEDKDIGTATQAAVPYGRVAGKTGTAQVREIERARYSDKTKDFRDRDHAWFASFAPAESPRLAVVVFLEHGGTGGKEAAPIARQIYEAYHQRVEPIFNTAASNDPPGGGRERVLP